MSSALQNRLVGTVIIVALVVIFLPDILDGKKQRRQDVFVDLPERPPMRAVEEPVAFPEAKVKQAVSMEPEALDAPIVDEPEEQTEAVATAQTAAGATDSGTGAQNKHTLEQQTQLESSEARLLQSAGWVVQLGVFRHEKNVRELLDKLQGAGYRAFSKPVETRSGQLTKVFVGPDLDKEKLQKAVPHLQQLTNLKGRITPFTVK